MWQKGKTCGFYFHISFKSLCLQQLACFAYLLFTRQAWSRTLLIPPCFHVDALCPIPSSSSSSSCSSCSSNLFVLVIPINVDMCLFTFSTFIACHLNQLRAVPKSNLFLFEFLINATFTHFIHHIYFGTITKSDTTNSKYFCKTCRFS